MTRISHLLKRTALLFPFFILCSFTFDRLPPVYKTAAAHSLIQVAPFGKTIELEDGSVWSINSFDSYKTLRWRTNDPLIITQNSRWFASYDYKIVNQYTETAIEANLLLGPVRNGEYTRYILSLDPVRGEIVLNDATRWEVSADDASTFLSWIENDPIIVGYNSGEDSSCNGILINVSMNDFVRTKQF